MFLRFCRVCILPKKEGSIEFGKISWKETIANRKIRLAAIAQFQGSHCEAEQIIYLAIKTS